MRDIKTFKLYMTSSDGLIIPRKGYNILLLVEQGKNGLPYIPNLPIRHRSYRILILPQFKVLGKMLKSIITQSKKELNSNRYKVYLWPQKSDLSFITDITRYIYSLYTRTTLIRFINRSISIINRLFTGVKNNNENVLLYVVDKAIITKNLSIRQLYIYWLIFMVEKKQFDKSNVDKVFITILDGKKSQVRLIYDKSQGNKNTGGRLRAFIKNALPNIHDKPPEINRNIDTAQLTKKIISSLGADISSLDLSIKNAFINIKSTLDASPQIKVTADKIFNKIPTNISKDEVKKADLEAKLIAKDILLKSVSSNTIPGTKVNTDEIRVTAQKDKILVNTAKKLGLAEVYNIDHNVTDEFKQEEFINNLPKIVASRLQESSATRLAKRVAVIVEPLLRDAGFKILDVSISNGTVDPLELARTDITLVKIKVKDPHNRRYTLTLNIPTIHRGQYILLGGKYWYFPNILANIPIFVIKPGKVQFRSNYASITAQYALYNKIKAVRFYIGGYKLPAILIFAYLRGFNNVLNDFNIKYHYSEEPVKDAVKLADNKYLVIDNTLNFEQQILLNELTRITKKCPIDTEQIISTITCFTKSVKTSYILTQVTKFIVDPETLAILYMRGLPTTLYDILRYMYDLAVHEVNLDKHELQNTYIKATNIILIGVMKAIAEGISNYRIRKVYKPNTKLTVNPNFVTTYLREIGILRLLQQQNPIEEITSSVRLRIVGPGALPSTMSVQKEDRNIQPSYFGNIDPVDTQESDPGVTITLATGVKYNMSLFKFVDIQPNKSYTYIFGPSSSMVPFATKDDPARLLMAANQQRQALPLVNSEHPIVQSGYEGAFVGQTSNKFAIRARANGKVVYVDENVIVLEYDSGKTDIIPIHSQRIQTGTGIDITMQHVPIVEVGDRVKQFQLLTKNEFIDKQIKLGTNAKVAYMSYKGYTYEDGIVITESFARKLTSVHYDEITAMLDKHDRIIKFPEIGKIYKTGEKILHIQKEIIKNSNLFEDNIITAPSDVEIIAIRIFPKWQGHMSEYIDKIAEYYDKTNKAIYKYSNKEYIMFNADFYKENYGKWKLHGKQLDYTYVIIEVRRYMTASIGDKLTNRHAAKGVITYIIEDKFAPRLPDNTPIDIIISPLSVISRMNMGQLFETHVGGIMELARKKVLDMYKHNTDRNTITKFITHLYELLDVFPNKTYSREVSRNITAMTDNEFNTYMKRLETEHMYIIMPPVNKLSIEQLEQAAKHVGYQFQYKLFLPEFNTYTKEPVTTGNIYIEKLEHMAAVKEHARHTGKYISTTLQPTKGKAKGGGQQFGEYDTYCLFAYDADKLIEELFAVNSDNKEIKRAVLNQIIEKGQAHLPTQYEPSGSVRMLNAYLVGMGIKPLS